MPLPYLPISLNCPPPRDQCFTYGANAVFLSSRSPSLGPDVAFIEAFPYLASSPVSRLKFTCKKGLNPVDTVQQRQLRAPLYLTISHIQCYYILIPTNITGNLDHCYSSCRVSICLTMTTWVTYERPYHTVTDTAKTVVIVHPHCNIFHNFKRFFDSFVYGLQFSEKYFEEYCCSFNCSV